MAKFIQGGIVAANGFTSNGIHCGIRKNKSKKDLALIACDVLANAAAVYTTNLVKGAPLMVTKKHLTDGKAQAIVCNSGNANTCNANGAEVAEQMAEIVGAGLKIAPSDVVVASTGVIGLPMDIAPIKEGMPELISGLGAKSADAANAIMTTDTILKEVAIEFEVGGVPCRIGGIAKGSGMIHPNMATMLVFVTTDVKITSELLQKALSADIKDSFNMVSVDGDTSTNDMVVVLASGLSGNKEITEDGDNYDAFCAALATVTRHLCRLIAGDGEGATKLLECIVLGAQTKDIARVAAKGVITSSLLKAAMFGADANWGRVLCALGYSGAAIDVDAVDVSFSSPAGVIDVCKNGAGIPFDEDVAKAILTKNEIQILVNLNSGSETATAWGCDLTYEYVKINGDYRT